ncbi:hypothetical protein DFH06DRAFT_1293007 [Mycena polygramma]|nr:hypothetical protein DFH06DRAFT_1293007 [Mycena polygramma]
MADKTRQHSGCIRILSEKLSHRIPASSPSAPRSLSRDRKITEELELLDIFLLLPRRKFPVHEYLYYAFSVVESLHYDLGCVPNIAQGGPQVVVQAQGGGFKHSRTLRKRHGLRHIQQHPSGVLHPPFRPPSLPPDKPSLAQIDFGVEPTDFGDFVKIFTSQPLGKKKIDGMVQAKRPFLRRRSLLLSDSQLATPLWYSFESYGDEGIPPEACRLQMALVDVPGRRTRRNRKFLSRR